MTALSEPQVEAIRAYTDAKYVEINAELRGDGNSDPRIILHIHHLDMALDSHPAHPALTVYRGVDATYAQELERSGLAAGDIIEDRAYLSTTPHLSVARSFMRHGDGGLLLKIAVPVGAKALSISEFSANPEEGEILIARGAHLRVICYDSDDDVLELELI